MPPETNTEAECRAGSGSPLPSTDRGTEENSSVSVPGTESPSELVTETQSGDLNDQGSDQASVVSDSAEGGSEKSGSDTEPTGIKVLKLTNSKRKGITDREYELALKLSDGNMHLAARGLGVCDNTVWIYVQRHPHLMALYGAQVEGKEVAEPTELSTMVRTPADIPSMIENSERAEMIMAQDREMLRDGLFKAGIKAETITRIRALDKLAKNAGSLLSASLDYTHRLHIYATAALFEEMIYIRDTKLRDSKMDPMAQVFWQRAFNEIADLLGKSNDRTMASTQAMVAMMKAKSGQPHSISGSAKAKPGWGNAS